MSKVWSSGEIYLKTCSNCACRKIRNSPDKNNLDDKLINLSLKIDHVASSKNCPIYVRAYGNLKSSIDFGPPPLRFSYINVDKCKETQLIFYFIMKIYRYLSPIRTTHLVNNSLSP